MISKGYLAGAVASATVCIVWAMALQMPVLAQTQTYDTGAPKEATDRAADILDPAALDRGKELYFSGDYAGAYAAWQPLADAGDARALYNLATLYRRGLGVAADTGKAAAMLLQSAEKGFPDAQYLRGTIVFEDAKSDETQKQEAVRWWLAAARQGHGLSQYRLGLLYWNGDAVARDLVRGRAWMSLAAQAAVDEAKDALSTMDRYLDDAQRLSAQTLATRLVESDGAAPLPERYKAPDGPGSGASPAVSSISGAGDPAPVRAHGATPSDKAAVDFGQSWRLQILALKDAAEVEKEWQRMLAGAPDLLGGLSYKVVPAHLGERGTFYRLQVGPFARREDADSRCRALKAAGLGCFIVTPDG